MIRKVILFSTLALVLGIISCNKDSGSDAKPTTVVEDKANIKKSFDVATDAARAIKEGDFVKFAVEFGGISHGNVANEDWIQKVLSSVEGAFVNGELISNDRLAYDLNKGKYTYNSSTNKWVKTTSTGSLEFIFPSSPTVASNNCSLILSGYVDQKFILNGDEIYIPTSFNAKLTKDGKAITSIDFSATFASNNNFPELQAMKFAFFAAPYSYSLTMSKPAANKWSVDITALDGSTSPIKLKMVATTGINTIENIAETDLELVTINLSEGDLAVVGSMDVKTFNALNSSTVSNLNKTLALDLNYQGAKIGEIKFADGEDGRELVVFYKDNTTENMMVYAQPMIDNLQTIYSDLFDNSRSSKIKRFFKSHISTIKKSIRG